jgi:hypothetical protein
MRSVGLLLALIGWLIPILALSMTQSNTARFAACVVGIAISLLGILAVLNKAHTDTAISKKG